MRGLQQAVVAGGDFLPDSRVGQEVSGELLLGELVKRGVVVEGLDDVVPVGRDVVVLVTMIPHGVRVANQVEPVDGHAFPEMGGGDQGVDQLLVGDFLTLKIGDQSRLGR